MNCKPAPAMLALLALTGALTFGIVACGHSSNHDAQQQPAPNATTNQLPPQPPYTAAQPAVSTAQPAASAAAPATAGSTGPGGTTPGFVDVAGSKGYITRQDAQRIPWLSQHFSQCDANGDGRVTQQEYSRCRQGPGQSTMQQPPALPPRDGSTSG